MRVSVVINTYNRAPSLRQTLGSLRLQTYDAFEVVVVNGPSTDATDQVLAEFAGRIRVGTCPDANLSRSRNIGIALASGDVVAFIDDDAVPEPRWLTELTAGYDSPRVAGVGGIVYDHTGHALQYGCCVCDRRAHAHYDITPPLWAYLLPQSDKFAHLIGTNASFRRDRLLEVGGFDEEIEYFLDETDVCLRLIDRGYRLRLLDNAAVLHKSLPSHLRGGQKLLRKPYPIVKNQFYFALRAARPIDSLRDVLRTCNAFADGLVGGARTAHAAGRLSAAELAAFEHDVERAVRDGIERGLHPRERGAALPPADPGQFLPFPTLRPNGRRLTVCFVSQEIPPERYGGIGRYTWDLAQGFAARGHEVHLLTRSPDHDRVDLEGDVWVHRLRSEGGPWNGAGLPPALTRNLNHAAAVHREVRRIADTRPVDLVSAPLWDCEGLYCLLDDDLTCVLSLQTTLQTVADMHPAWQGWTELPQLLALERQAVRAAQFVHAISEDILRKVRRDCGAPVAPAEAHVLPLGIADRAGEYRPRPADGRLRVLFVGRLEKRKGTDLFLDAAARLAPAYPHVDFVLVGDDTIVAEDGVPYRETFQRLHGQAPWSRRIVFRGPLPEPELYQQYADCDVFCLPARYESFGLVFLEAMQFGKPVVGTAAGGMTEVVEDGGNGFLVPPENAAALADCLGRLLDDVDLRRRFGLRSRRLFEAEFTGELMVERTLRAYADIVARGRSSEGTCRGAA
jgi:glycosyltransferase involved in cell wall biosynthesis